MAESLRKIKNEIRKVKASIEEANADYEAAYADAYCRSPETARELFGVPQSRMTNGMMEQVTKNDESVKRSKKRITQLKSVLADLEERKLALEEQNQSIPARERMEGPLSGIHLEEIDDNAMTVLSDVREQVVTISETLKELVSEIERGSIPWDRKFWEDNILKHAVGAKIELTDYIEIIRDIKSRTTDKDAEDGLKEYMFYMIALRDDCKDMIDQARLQLRGW